LLEKWAEAETKYKAETEIKARALVYLPGANRDTIAKLFGLA